MSTKDAPHVAPASFVEAKRQLSPWRVLLALVLLAGISFGSFYGYKTWRTMQPTSKREPWFAPYVDVTATPSFAFEQLGNTSHKDVVLSFIVASPTSPCTPTWGATYSLDQARASLDLERRIARLQEQGGSVAISFGGRDNQELAITCSDENALVNAYQSVIDRYNIDTIDLDLERQSLSDPAAAARRAAALAQLQSSRRESGKPLAIWITLPVAPQGLTEDGTNAIAALLAKGVDLAGINVMTMDYGSSRGNQSMLDASESAVAEAARQIGILYQQVHIHLNDASIWAKVGVTPMVGQNDDQDEVFTLADATAFNAYTHAQGITRVSMWSANRDLACGSNYVFVKVVSDSCSGVDQSPQAFANALGANFTGIMSRNAGLVTKADPTSAEVEAPDDPATSPYPIWSVTAAYLQGTKVVWHHTVYEAKWWTQGDVPDNPVLQSWQTPWQLIGPVLPGEKPIPQATLPAGTYPNWSGSTVYNTGDRVLFNDVPYQAKWWNQGDSPAAASSAPDSSPWAPLTQTEINTILAQDHKAS